MNADAVREREKEAAFYERQEERNASWSPGPGRGGSRWRLHRQADLLRPDLDLDQDGDVRLRLATSPRCRSASSAAVARR